MFGSADTIPISFKSVNAHVSMILNVPRHTYQRVMSRVHPPKPCSKSVWHHSRALQRWCLRWWVREPQCPSFSFFWVSELLTFNITIESADAALLGVRVHHSRAKFVIMSSCNLVSEWVIFSVRVDNVWCRTWENIWLPPPSPRASLPCRVRDNEFVQLGSRVGHIECQSRWSLIFGVTLERTYMTSSSECVRITPVQSSC